MDYTLKRPKFLPIIFIATVAMYYSVTLQSDFAFLSTALIGSAITLTLFGTEGFNKLYSKMVAPIWFPIFMAVINDVFVGLVAALEKTSTNNSDLFTSSAILGVRGIHSFWDTFWYIVEFMFSAVNEELFILPVLLAGYVFFKKSQVAWYASSLVTGIIFALLHFAVYPLSAWTIVALAGSRMIMNETFRLTESIYGPMIMHFVIDSVVLASILL